jgi:hypothetical protein
MKYSKQLSIFQRKQKWGRFMKLSSDLRLYLFNNSFETYCKNTKE